MPGHPAGPHMCPVTLPFLYIRIYAQVPLWFPYLLGLHSSFHMCPGTISVPICAWEPFRSPYVPGLAFDPHICLGTPLVPIYAWALFQCPYVPRHPSVHHSVAHMPRHHSGVNMFLGTFLVPICAWAPLQCPYVPCSIPVSIFCPCTLPVLIDDWGPLRCQYVPGHPSLAHM